MEEQTCRICGRVHHDENYYAFEREVRLAFMALMEEMTEGDTGANRSASRNLRLQSNPALLSSTNSSQISKLNVLTFRLMKICTRRLSGLLQSSKLFILIICWQLIVDLAKGFPAFSAVPITFRHRQGQIPALKINCSLGMAHIFRWVPGWWSRQHAEVCLQKRRVRHRSTYQHQIHNGQSRRRQSICQMSQAGTELRSRS